MTNEELADLLEEAARRLRSSGAEFSSCNPKPASRRDGLTVVEAAIKMGLKAWTVRNKIRLGKIAASKVHGEWILPEKEIDLYLRAQKSMGANRAMRRAIKYGRM